jgi:hypothetical protein
MSVSRPSTSASAPAGRASRKNGRLVAVCTRATIRGHGVSEVISHTAPVLCIQVPTLDVTVASYSARKSGWRNGLYADVITTRSRDSISSFPRTNVCDLWRIHWEGHPRQPYVDGAVTNGRLWTCTTIYRRLAASGAASFPSSVTQMHQLQTRVTSMPSFHAAPSSR